MYYWSLCEPPFIRGLRTQWPCVVLLRQYAALAVMAWRNAYLRSQSEVFKLRPRAGCGMRPRVREEISTGLPKDDNLSKNTRCIQVKVRYLNTCYNFNYAKNCMGLYAVGLPRSFHTLRGLRTKKFGNHRSR